MSAESTLVEAGLKRYVEYYEKLSLDTVEQLRNLAVSNLYFKDPFNEVSDVERVIRIMKHMFESSEAPAFGVLDSVLKDNTAYLKWDFRFSSKSLNKGEQIKVIGMSELEFNEQGLVTKHVDYWDASEQLYEYVPILGAMLRLVKRNLKVD